jgi:hypothetical protein
MPDPRRESPQGTRHLLLTILGVLAAVSLLAVLLVTVLQSAG